MYFIECYIDVFKIRLVITIVLKIVQMVNYSCIYVLEMLTCPKTIEIRERRLVREKHLSKKTVRGKLHLQYNDV